ncbi:ThiF family adenylyltransferase [Xenorhabdus khoisanae]|uniref:ThiF family adenylyltransferase n=1 Tax=Xenorhabdus khoisanae TaxID=880157 RepID=UPI0023586E0C|nr:ThiF family adenylyltransferase [Xenorhabdus khoisanae]MDC9613059.1 ThiF family adenylyltransferase [Xenorhabdus khoisanae]
MDYASILEYFLDSEFDVQPSSYSNADTLSVCVEIGGRLVTLVHFCVDELQQLPHFFLKDPASFGVLAHVLKTQNFEEMGSICVNHLDSVSINFERPELAFEESIRRHVKLLRSLIVDSEFNQSELLREFSINWYLSTKNLMNKSPKTLYCTSLVTNFTKLDIYKPISSDSVMSIFASFIAQPYERNDQKIARFFKIDSRLQQKDAIGYIIPLQSIDPVVPSTADELKVWLLEALQSLSPETKSRADKELFPIRAKEFWLVLNMTIPSGKSWIGLKISLDKKRTFPLTFEKMKPWKIEPIFVEIFNKEHMLPRSGANLSFDNKKVLLIGCGSVGSEIAHKLGSAGIGSIDIADPDQFSTSNLYRHTLEGYKVGWPKALAVAFQLQAKFPWLKTNGYRDSLLDYRKKSVLSAYDLVIIAIGAPTHERLFHDYLVKSRVKVPVIYSWLEGYGIGGHAVLDIPHKLGCLRCAYVEQNTGVRGLASNLNFIEPDQNVVKNYAGCGEMYIPYGANNSTQTALIAADLAIGYLEGKLTESKKVSWKGDNSDAEHEGLKLTRRYKTFSSSLKKLPLRHPLCDICQPKELITYQSNSGKRFCLPKALHQKLCNYRQQEPTSVESAGLLIGYYNQSGEVLINTFTTPKASDQRTRTTFKLDAQAHQAEIEEAYIASDQLLGYVGTWHTHPQNIPLPSSIDKTDWRTHEQDNSDRSLFFIVIGIKRTSVYTLEEGKIIELSNIQE